MQRQETTTPSVELEGHNKTQELKDILEKVTSLTIDEADVIKAILSISRSLG